LGFFTAKTPRNRLGKKQALRDGEARRRSAPWERGQLARPSIPATILHPVIDGD
jgi:hypothetical protein